MSTERNTAKTWMTVRLVLTVVMLAVLVPRLRPSTLFPDGHLQTVLWMTGALLVAVFSMVLSAFRWQQMLHALELPATMPPLVAHTFAGLFVSNFLPTTIGGDVLRASRLGASNGHRKVSAASVVLERLTGFICLPLISLVALLATPSLLKLGAASRIALLLTLGPLVGLSVFMVLAANPWLGERLGGRRWMGLAMTVHLGLVRLRRHPGLALTVMAAAMAYQLSVILVSFMAAQALGLSISWTAMMAFIPVVAIAQSLPLSIGGLGIREGSLVVLFGPLGVSDSHAVALGLLLYAINMAVSLLGAPSFLVGARRRLEAAPA